MLPIEHIINSISSTYLYRIDLIQIEMGCRIQYMLFGNISLILLIRYKVFNRDLLKMDIGNKHTIICHQVSPSIALSIS